MTRSSCLLGVLLLLIAPSWPSSTAYAEPLMQRVKKSWVAMKQSRAAWKEIRDAAEQRPELKSALVEQRRRYSPARARLRGVKESAEWAFVAGYTGFMYSLLYPPARYAMSKGDHVGAAICGIGLVIGAAGTFGALVGSACAIKKGIREAGGRKRAILENTARRALELDIDLTPATREIAGIE